MKLQFITRAFSWNHVFEVEVTFLTFTLLRIVITPKYYELVILGIGYQLIED